MDINVVKIFILEKLKKCMVKRLVICILILKIELNNVLVCFSFLKYVGQKFDLDDGWFCDGFFGVQELVMKEVVLVCVSECYRVVFCVLDLIVFYYVSQNNGIIFIVYF